MFLKVLFRQSAGYFAFNRIIISEAKKEFIEEWNGSRERNDE